MIFCIFVLLLCASNSSNLFASQVPDARPTPLTSVLKNKRKNSPQSIVNTRPSKQAKKEKTIPEAIDPATIVQDTVKQIAKDFTTMLNNATSSDVAPTQERLLKKLYRYKTKHGFIQDIAPIGKAVKALATTIYQYELTTVEPHQDVIKQSLRDISGSVGKLVSLLRISNNASAWAIEKQDVFNETRSRILGQYELTIRAFQAMDKDFSQEFLPVLKELKRIHTFNIESIVAEQKRRQELLNASMEKVRSFLAKVKAQKERSKKQTV